MKIKELIEIAQLYTLGILDDADASEFEAAFAAASPGVQAQVRREQARLSQLHGLLPEVEARPELRERVIGAVRDAAARPLPVAAAIRHEAGRVPTIVSGKRVSRLWRTAAVSFAAIAVVLGGFSVYVKNAQSQLQHKLETDAFTAAVVKDLAPRFSSELLFGKPEHYNFTNTDPKLACRAAVVISRQADNAQFFYNLPSNNSEVYQLVELDDQDQIKAPLIKEFTSPGGIQSQPIKLTPGAVTRLAIRAGVKAADSSIQWTVVATVKIG